MIHAWKSVDKSKWPRGEWDDEYDKAYWVDEATGLDCLIVRNPYGALCGYVGVPKGHSLYGKSMAEVWRSPYELDCHGGVTFADSGYTPKSGNYDQGICAPFPEGRSTDIWWIGFDCNHLYDIAPGMNREFIETYIDASSTYRNFKYVTREVEKLARDLKGAV